MFFSTELLALQGGQMAKIWQLGISSKKKFKNDVVMRFQMKKIIVRLLKEINRQDAKRMSLFLSGTMIFGISRVIRTKSEMILKRVTTLRFEARLEQRKGVQLDKIDTTAIDQAIEPAPDFDDTQVMQQEIFEAELQRRFDAVTMQDDDIRLFDADNNFGFGTGFGDEIEQDRDGAVPSLFEDEARKQDSRLPEMQVTAINDEQSVEIEAPGAPPRTRGPSLEDEICTPKPNADVGNAGAPGAISAALPFFPDMDELEADESAIMPSPKKRRRTTMVVTENDEEIFDDPAQLDNNNAPADQDLAPEIVDDMPPPPLPEPEVVENSHHGSTSPPPSMELSTLEPRDATPKRGKKKRKLIVDRVTQISKEEMAANREALNNNDEDELAPEWAMRPVPFWKSGKDLLENPTRRTQFSKTEFLDIARDIPRFEGFERNVVAEEQDDQVQEEPVIETGMEMLDIHEEDQNTRVSELREQVTAEQRRSSIRGDQDYVEDMSNIDMLPGIPEDKNSTDEAYLSVLNEGPVAAETSRVNLDLTPGDQQPVHQLLLAVEEATVTKEPFYFGDKFNPGDGCSRRSAARAFYEVLSLSKAAKIDATQDGIWCEITISTY